MIVVRDAVTRVPWGAVCQKKPLKRRKPGSLLPIIILADTTELLGLFTGVQVSSGSVNFHSSAVYTGISFWRGWNAISRCQENAALIVNSQ